MTSLCIQEQFHQMTKLSLEARRERTASHKLLFQSGRQSISFAKTGRKVVLVILVPTAHGFPVVIVVIVFVAIVIVVMFVMTLSLSVSMPLRHRDSACEREDSNRKGNDPFCRAHRSLRS